MDGRDLENGWGEDVEDARMGRARTRRMGRAKRCMYWGHSEDLHSHNFQKILFVFLGVVVEVVVAVVDELIVARETPGGALLAVIGYTICGHCCCC